MEMRSDKRTKETARERGSTKGYKLHNYHRVSPKHVLSYLNLVIKVINLVLVKRRLPPCVVNGVDASRKWFNLEIYLKVDE